MPSLSLTDRKVTYNGDTVGVYALDSDSGEIVAVCWKSLYRKFDSFAFSGPLLDDIDASKIFVVDKSDDSVYLFLKSDYQDGPMVKTDRGFQYVLERSASIAAWDSLDDILE